MRPKQGLPATDRGHGGASQGGCVADGGSVRREVQGAAVTEFAGRQQAWVHELVLVTTKEEENTTEEEEEK